MSSYYKSESRARDMEVIEWDPPAVNFEFIAGVCVQHDPSPYCSFGHKTKASCDCEPIADNE